MVVGRLWADVRRKGTSLGMHTSVPCSEYFLGPERVFWSEEERMPLESCRWEWQALWVSWVEGGPEGVGPCSEDLN